MATVSHGFHIHGTDAARGHRSRGGVWTAGGAGHGRSRGCRRVVGTSSSSPEEDSVGCTTFHYLKNSSALKKKRRRRRRRRRRCVCSLCLCSGRGHSSPGFGSSRALPPPSRGGGRGRKGRRKSSWVSPEEYATVDLFCALVRQSLVAVWLFHTSSTRSWTSAPEVDSRTLTRAPPEARVRCLRRLGMASGKCVCIQRLLDSGYVFLRQFTGRPLVSGVHLSVSASPKEYKNLNYSGCGFTAIFLYSTLCLLHLW